MDDLAGLAKRFKLGPNQLRGLPAIHKSASDFGKRRASEIGGEKDNDRMPPGKRGKPPVKKKPIPNRQPPTVIKPYPKPDPGPTPVPRPTPTSNNGPSAEEALGVKKKGKPVQKGIY